MLETGAGRDILNIPKFGLWMVVSRKRNPRVNKGKELVRDLDRDHRSNFSSSSYFVVLSNDTDGDFDKETKCEELVLILDLHVPTSSPNSHKPKTTRRVTYSR